VLLTHLAAAGYGIIRLVLPVLLGIKAPERFIFGSEAVFIMGVFIQPTALLKSFFHPDGALPSPERLEVAEASYFQVMLTAALLSFIMSEHAVAAMIFPVLLVIVNRLNVARTSSSVREHCFGDGMGLRD
jgi:sodium-dependent dicarboxylate transporter 2/3/5